MATTVTRVLVAEGTFRGATFTLTGQRVETWVPAGEYAVAGVLPQCDKLFPGAAVIVRVVRDSRGDHVSDRWYTSAAVLDAA